jgi:hypothetical protein
LLCTQRRCRDAATDVIDRGADRCEARCDHDAKKGAGVTTALIGSAELDVPEVSSPAPTGALVQAVGRAVAPPAGIVVRVSGATAGNPPDDIVDQWGVQSLPASDQPANW